MSRPPLSRRKLTVATRRSALALAQCRAFIEEFGRRTSVEVEELHVVTTGDRITDRPLAEIGGKGLFLKEIEEALLDGRADFAVHSMKDVPPALDPRLVISCVPEREDPRDVLFTFDGRPLEELDEGATLGTSSLRRATQLLLLRPDLRVVPLRGNVQTRLRQCRERKVDATVLARAGLNRLGLDAQHTLEPEHCLPAVGQGALAIEQRSDDAELSELLAPLADRATTIMTASERGLMKAVEGDCKTPVAAFAVRDGAQLHLRGFVAETDGSRARFADERLSWPSGDLGEAAAEAADFGFELGRRLLASG